VSIFKAILNKIFPSNHPANDAAAPATAPAQAPGAEPAVTAAPATTLPPVDVQAVLADMQAKQSQPLNWKTSIVDLLKLLGLDSSLQARKQLAGELGYTGSTDDSAAMNVWLHKQVIKKLAENGGKLPDDLK
jgi:3-oxoacyl-ACP reductase-like protein